MFVYASCKIRLFFIFCSFFDVVFIPTIKATAIASFSLPIHVSVTEQEQENASRLFFVDHCWGFLGHFVWNSAASKKGIILIDFLSFSSVYCF